MRARNASPFRSAEFFEIEAASQRRAPEVALS